jgi:hypothetical protein
LLDKLKERIFGFGDGRGAVILQDRRNLPRITQ